MHHSQNKVIFDYAFILIMFAFRITPTTIFIYLFIYFTGVGTTIFKSGSK